MANFQKLQLSLIYQVPGQIWQILQISAVICRILQIPPGPTNSKPKFLSKELAKFLSKELAKFLSKELAKFLSKKSYNLGLVPWGLVGGCGVGGEFCREF